MGSKRDWNDVSDQESEQEQNVSLDNIDPTQDNQLPQEPILAKVVSSPLPEKKSPTNQQENLKKLQNCSNQKIWLYNPLFYKDNVEEVDNIFKKSENFIKIEKFSKGWNVLTSREEATKLIVEGKKEQRFFLKFYFSNKNDQSTKKYNNYKNYDNNNEKKVKYIPKSPNSKFSMKDLKQPDVMRKIQSQNDYQMPNRMPKSPSNKYSGRNANNNIKNKETGSDNYKRQNMRSHSKGSTKPTKTYKPKYVAKSPTEQKQHPKSVQDNHNSISTKNQSKLNQQESTTSNTNSNTAKNSQKDFNKKQEIQYKNKEQKIEEKKIKKKKSKKNEVLRDDVIEKGNDQGKQ